MLAFDPWQLLGLKSTSTVDEARRAYYRLAVIMHPDKGGSAEDMRILYEAYKWIYQQLEGASIPITVDDPSKTPIIDTVMGMDRASLEVCYERLSPSGARTEGDENTKAVALDWVKYLVERDLMTESELKSLEEYVQEGIGVVLQAKTMGGSYAAIPEGYGSYMDHEPREKEDIKPNQHRFSKELAKYAEPLCPSQAYIARNQIDMPQKLDDYSDIVGGLCMTDYALAHSKHVISDTEAYEEERAMFSCMSVSNTPPCPSPPDSTTGEGGSSSASSA